MESLNLKMIQEMNDEVLSSVDPNLILFDDQDSGLVYKKPKNNDIFKHLLSLLVIYVIVYFVTRNDKLTFIMTKKDGKMVIDPIKHFLFAFFTSVIIVIILDYFKLFSYL